jgi:hypothetical protein
MKPSTTFLCLAPLLCPSGFAIGIEVGKEPIMFLVTVLLAVRMSLQIVLDALLLEETAVIDSAPVPCVSYKRGEADSDFPGKADLGMLY